MIQKDTTYLEMDNLYEQDTYFDLSIKLPGKFILHDFRTNDRINYLTHIWLKLTVDSHTKLCVSKILPYDLPQWCPSIVSLFFSGGTVVSFEMS